jgi:hypothetical protein
VTDFELEWILKVSGIHGETGLVVRKEVILGHVRRPYYLSLVQDFMDFQNRPLLIRSAGMYRSEESCLRLAFELHYDAADIGRIRHPQEHSALNDIEVGVMLVRVIERDCDQHCRLAVVARSSYTCLLFVVRSQGNG